VAGNDAREDGHNKNGGRKRMKQQLHDWLRVLFEGKSFLCPHKNSTNDIFPK